MLNLSLSFLNVATRRRGGGEAPPPGEEGILDFSDEDNSGLLILLEDI